MFNIIFGPAMTIMSRLRFGLKIGLIGLLFLTPLTALLVYLYGKLHAEISTPKPSASAFSRLFQGGIW